ncbi:hypothetical protein COEX109129_19895 [Corallococcus exiguus]
MIEMAPKRWPSVMLAVFILVSFICIASRLSSGASRALTALGEQEAASPELVSHLYAVVSLSALQEVMFLKAAILAIALGCAVVGLAGLVHDFESVAPRPVTLEDKNISPTLVAAQPPPAPIASAASAQPPSVLSAPTTASLDTTLQAARSAPTPPASTPATPAQEPHASTAFAAVVTTPLTSTAPVQISPASAETAAPVKTPPVPPTSARTSQALAAHATPAPVATAPAQQQEEGLSAPAPRKGTVLVFLIGLGAGLVLLSAQIRPELKPPPLAITIASPGSTGSSAARSRQVDADGGLPDAGELADVARIASDRGLP